MDGGSFKSTTAVPEAIAPLLAPGMKEVLAAEAALSANDPPDAIRPPVHEAEAYWSVGAPEPVEIEDGTYTNAAGDAMALRIYRGRSDRPQPALLYIHGGGWCTGSIGLNDPATRALAVESGRTVISITYRLAPENPFPAGSDDCLAALSWVRANADAIGVLPDAIAVGGASAGANLALVSALRAGRGVFDGLVLLYGVFGADQNTDSYREFGDAGPGLTRSRMRALFNWYDPQGWRVFEPRIAPMLANLSGLPPAILIAAGIDVLRSDSEAMHARMTEAGVASRLSIVPGVHHGFINRGRHLPAARAALSDAAAFLRAPHHTD